MLLYCHKNNCAFADIISAIRSIAAQPGFKAELLRSPPTTEANEREDRVKRLRAKHIWEQGGPILGTPVEAYLKRRSITWLHSENIRYLRPENTQLPPIGYHEMIARVQGPAGNALHRTLLTSEGNKALGSRSRRQFARTSGGAVQLSEGRDSLVVAEGIETALSLLCGLLDGQNSVWSALSTSGMKNLKLPEKSGRLIIAIDGDEAGRTAAMTLACRADDLGWQVSLVDAPEGQDFNDTLINHEKD